MQRTFDVCAEEEDTPTKRAKVCSFRFAQNVRTFELYNPSIENLQELSDSQQEDYAWGQSPVLARFRTRFSSECEQADCQQPDRESLSDDLLASGHSSTSYADLCCGESDVFQDRQPTHPSTNPRRHAWEPAEPAPLHRTKSEPQPRSHYSSINEDETVLKEMIRYVSVTLLTCTVHSGLLQMSLAQSHCHSAHPKSR